MFNWLLATVGLSLRQNTLVKLMVVSIVMDMIFGSLRALRERKFNSSVGIDGGIRKVGMLMCVVCLAFVDVLMPMNLIAFVPAKLRDLAFSPKEVTIMGLFALLFLLFETLSVLKNMTLSGLPVRVVWEKVHKFLSKNTNEIFDLSEIDPPGQKKKGHNKIVHLDKNDKEDK